MSVQIQVVGSFSDHFCSLWGQIGVVIVIREVANKGWINVVSTGALTEGF
jgi:hypothetical protein